MQDTRREAAVLERMCSHYEASGTLALAEGVLDELIHPSILLSDVHNQRPLEASLNITIKENSRKRK